MKGFSEPWPIVLKELGGSENIDPQSIIKYFEPLINFLDLALAEANQCVGWGGESEEYMGLLAQGAALVLCCPI